MTLRGILTSSMPRSQLASLVPPRGSSTVQQACSPRPCSCYQSVVHSQTLPAMLKRS